MDFDDASSTRYGKMIHSNRNAAPPMTPAASRTWMCLICGFVYDEAMGLPDEGIPPGTRWEDIPPNWTCPECGARKEDFEMVPL